MEAAREEAVSAAAAAAVSTEGVEVDEETTASTSADVVDADDDAATRLSASATSGTARDSVSCKGRDVLLLVRREWDGAEGAKRSLRDEEANGRDRAADIAADTDTGAREAEDVEQHAAEARDALALIGAARAG